MSLGVYCMVAFRRGSPRAAEGGMKYFLLGSFAAAILLFGAALLYGATGHTDFAGIGESVRSGHAEIRLLVLGIVMLLVGLLFKVSAVPFHMWTPDAYEGAMTPATTFMSVVVKTGAFAVLMRVVLMCFSDELSASMATGWPSVIVPIAAITMIYGNVAAAMQSNVKRMLAYSSIAHAGYLMIAVTAAFAIGPHGTEFYHGIEAILFYLVAYALMTLGAFGAIIGLRVGDRPVESIRQLAGLGWTRPWPALALAICLLSLSGIPPLLGFWGKFEIFAAAISARSLEISWSLLALAILGVLTAAVGAYYYLRIVVLMYLSPAQEELQSRGGWPVATSVAACASLTVVLGLFWGTVAQTARMAAHAAMAHPDPPHSGVTQVADATATQP
jgi:NADH-quinone oxidoreductase subunit N